MIRLGWIGSFLVIAVSVCAVNCSCGEDASVYDRAEEMASRGDYKGAEEALKIHVAANGRDYRAMAQLGAVYIEMGEKKRAAKYLNDAVKLDPDYPIAHLFLGRLYFMSQKGDEAIRQFRIFIDRMKPLVASANQNIGVYISSLHYITDVSEDLKRYDMMKAAIDEILRLNPKDQSARYNLGVYYYNGAHDRPKAYQSFKAAIDLEPASEIAKRAKYAIEFMRSNPDSRVEPDMSFIDQEYRE